MKSLNSAGLVLFLLPACGGLNPVGVRIDPPAPEILFVCKKPQEFLDETADMEILAGRIGDELLRCGKSKEILAEWAIGISQTLDRNGY